FLLMLRTTITSAHTWPCAKTRRWVGRSSDLAPLSPSQSYPACTTTTFGYNFRKGQDEAKDIQEAAQGLGVQVFVVRAGKADDVEAAFTTLVQREARAVIVGSDTFFTSRRGQISLLAARRSLPTMWVTRIEVEAGGLMSYGANIPDVYRRAGVYAGQVLKGAKPANLPVQLPTKFAL